MTITVEKGLNTLMNNLNHLVLYPNFNDPDLTIRDEPFQVIKGAHNTYGLLTKREVKMAGYWPSSFFCVFMDRHEVEVHKHAKKEANTQPS